MTTVTEFPHANCTGGELSGSPYTVTLHTACQYYFIAYAFVPAPTGVLSDSAIPGVSAYGGLVQRYVPRATYIWFGFVSDSV